jgi:Zn-finger nucleic acid-binding protein
MQLTCPKCQGAMRQYERSGVHVDQCTECRGIFLDRGELERMIDAETSFQTSAAPAAPVPSGRPQQGYQPQPYQQSGHDQRGHDQRGHGQHGHDQHGYGEHGYGQHKKKKRSFLEDLFD